MIKKKINKKKILIVSSIIIGFGITCYAVYKGYKGYLMRKVNRKGSDYWIEFASLAELEKYREEIREKLANAFTDGLSNTEYAILEKKMNIIDNHIIGIKMLFMKKDIPIYKLDLESTVGICQMMVSVL